MSLELVKLAFAAKAVLRSKYAEAENMTIRKEPKKSGLVTPGTVTAAGVLGSSFGLLNANRRYIQNNPRVKSPIGDALLNKDIDTISGVDPIPKDVGKPPFNKKRFKSIESINVKAFEKMPFNKEMLEIVESLPDSAEGVRIKRIVREAADRRLARTAAIRGGLGGAALSIGGLIALNNYINFFKKN